MAKIQTIQNLLLKEKPKIPKAVKATLATVMVFVVNFCAILPEKKLEIMVHKEISIETMPEKEILTSRS